MGPPTFETVHYLWLVPMLPALGAAVLGLFGRKIEYWGAKEPWGNDPAKYNYDWHDPDAHHGPGQDVHGTHGGHDDGHGHGGHALAPGQSAAGMRIVNWIACGTMLAAALIST